MKYIKQCIIWCIIYLISLVQTRFIEEEDGYCLIYVNNTFGIDTGYGYQKRQEPQQFVTSVMEEIHQLIIENKDTYKNIEGLQVLEEKKSFLKKRSNDIYINDVYQISSLNDITVLSSYFSFEINEMVKSIPGILGSEPKRKMKLVLPKKDIVPLHKEKRDFSDFSRYNSFINNLKFETKWKDVEIRENTDLHLSLMSQGIFNGTSDQYDTNYYYPKTAGEDIDIYIIDSGFNFKHPEFSNTNERTVKCLGTFSNGTIIEPESDDYCASGNIHGELTSDCASGINHGAASKANIYGIALAMEDEYEETFDTESFIMILDYISKNIKMRPYKSIINISMGESFSFKDTNFYDYTQKIFDHFNKQGVVTFVSAGNDGNKVYDIENDSIYLPCALDSVICVGAIDSNGSDRDPDMSLREYFSDQMNPQNYIRADFSNYGEKVNIYGPGYAKVEYQGTRSSMEFVYPGTSLTTPLIAGIAATIMSEHPEIQFNTDSMLSYLTLNGHRDILGNIPEGPNIFINNGRKSVYIKNTLKEDTKDNFY